MGRPLIVKCVKFVPPEKCQSLGQHRRNFMEILANAAIEDYGKC
jgi:hypothetical protein